MNGDFQTGNLTGWTTYTTANGTVGGAGFPNVVSFNTTGTGASLAAHFRVGQVTFVSGSQQGGGLIQSMFLEAGSYNVTANVAAFNSNPVSTNSGAGRFALLVDGTERGFIDLSPIGPLATNRGLLNVTFTVATTGVHEFRFQITRPFLINAQTPEQYLDNAVINAVPEPASLTLAGLGAMALAGYAWRKRRVSKAA